MIFNKLKAWIFLLLCGVLFFFSSCEKHEPEIDEGYFVQQQTEIEFLNAEESELRNSSGDIDVYLIIGQSNSYGGGVLGTESSYFRPYVQPFSPILFTGRKARHKWNTNATTMPWGGLRPRYYDNNQYGCELRFGRELYNRKSVYRNNVRKLAIIKCGVGGTSMIPATSHDSWDVYLREKTIQYVNAKINDLIAMGYQNVRVKGLVWIQGEADIFHNGHRLYQYPGKLHTMLNEMKRRIRRAQNMKVALVGLNPNASGWNGYKPKLREFNQRLQGVANSNPNYHYVNTYGLDMKSPTDIHYNANSLMTLGLRVVNVF